MRRIIVIDDQPHAMSDMDGVTLNSSQRTALEFLPQMPELNGVVCLQKPIRPPDLLKAMQAAFALTAYVD